MCRWNSVKIEIGDNNYCQCWVEGRATPARSSRLDVLVLRLLHRLWFLLHAEPLHWCHHRKFQYAEKEDECYLQMRCLLYDLLYRQYFKFNLITDTGKPLRYQMLFSTKNSNYGKYLQLLLIYSFKFTYMHNLNVLLLPSCDRDHWAWPR